MGYRTDPKAVRPLSDLIAINLEPGRAGYIFPVKREGADAGRSRRMTLVAPMPLQT
ncbi:hypothetical protein [Bradyrhizobium sp. HKCCYLS3013]|uniref:hypothetical protein n=1 Tax=Bradyrhizobium sp. HKCCYLS3013 TaxID=3420735 RepID=UPI003EBEBF6A